MSELSRDEAALACALHAMGWHQHYTNCVEQAKVTIRNAPESIRTALTGPAVTKDEEWLAAFEEWKRHWRGAKTGPAVTDGKPARGDDGTPCVTVTGGGGGEKHADTPRQPLVYGRDAWEWHGAFLDASRKSTDLLSRLAAAEKRAEEAERRDKSQIVAVRVGNRYYGKDDIEGLIRGQDRGCEICTNQRDSIQLERDAALARVKELEAKCSDLQFQANVANGALGVAIKDSPLAGALSSLNDRVRAIESTIRDAAGAQP